MDVYFEVHMLGKTWTFYGIDAIRELVAVMDGMCSESRSDHHNAPLPTLDPPVPAAPTPGISSTQILAPR